MNRVLNITDEAYQEHRLLFDDAEIVIGLRFHPTIQIWTIDVTYKDWTIYGQKLSLNVLHIESQNRPFDFVVFDQSGAGLDPFRATDFSEGRCVLCLLDAAEMRTIRGGPVPL